MSIHMPRIAVLAVLLVLVPAVKPSAGQDSSPGLGDSEYVPGAFRVYSGAGEASSLNEITNAMTQHQVVFIGETHDDPTGHMLELELLQRAVFPKDFVSDTTSDPARTVALSLEFFQHDVQPILNEYLADLITERSFVTDSRPWPRYKTDYRPLIEFAKSQELAVIAANAPRRYTNRVSRLGRESLSDLGPDALENLPPLPYGQPSVAYRDQWIQVITSVMAEEMTRCGKPIEIEEPTSENPNPTPPAGAHGNMGNQLHSQVLWDASMAYWISDHLKSHPDDLVLHMVGSFHVARGTGTPEHLESYRPGMSSMIIMLRSVDDINTFEPAPTGTWGDFVIQTDRSKTLEAIECARLN